MSALRSLLRRGLVMLLVLLAGVGVPSALAVDTTAFEAIIQTPLCPNALGIEPANPAFIHSADTILYRWQGEPPGTARRDLAFFNVAPLTDQGGNVLDGAFSWLGFLEIVPVPNPDSAYHALLGASGLAGTFNWTVIFYDGAGNRLCRLDFYWLDVRGTAPPSQVEPVAVASVFECNGAVLIALRDSPLFGTPRIRVDGDDFDGSGINCPLIIHGNNNANILIGGGLNDQIFGYAGNDTIYGGAGDDFLDGGHEECLGDFCSAGDWIDGGEGNDRIVGGDETCPGPPNFCNVGEVGDIIFGGPGDDSIFGGNESCPSSGNDDGCVGFGGVTDLGDNISGGPGDDTIYGGDESCTGTNCQVGQDGDIINGDDGNDNLFGDGGNDTLNGGGGDDSLDGGGETDTCTGETESNCEA